ncbi:hypothetical protein N9017_01910 [Akkermansiaceae bacterium]|nr:hypothetical protein [Akkermansiaceae bacterium]
MNRYEIRFQPWNGSWCLSGPVGATGRLLFTSAKDAASHARWDARRDGGKIEVFDQQGQLFKTITVDEDTGTEDGFVLPSV